MHLVQTPGETVYEIKLADLLCSLALEPKTFLKCFAKETSIEAKKNPFPKPTNPKQQKSPLSHVFKGTCYSNEEKRKKWRKEKEHFPGILKDGDYPSFNNKIFIYVKIPVSRTRIMFPKHLLD